MSVKMDHIGIAVQSLQQAMPKYRALLQKEPDHVEEVPGQGVKVAMFRAGDSSIELLEPLGPDSPIARHIAKRGEGIHHICLAVENMDAVLKEAEQAGLEIIPQKDDRGAGGHRIAFLHPKSTGGVLIELVEK
ncbi:MAG: methylmalonyl-CoA epimerase [candidate division KSB1 bacterium]|nr:methylmalonyl-CoA epimerase [candidate division KSB1 bacterium]